MPQQLVCSQGHRWESAGAGDDLPTCPVCGTAPSAPTIDQTQNTAGYVPASSSAGTKPVAAVTIPGYEIFGVLGRGGMGVVYKARHLKLKRLVALKMILSGAHAGPDDLERFRLEAEAVANLQHANVVQIYEVGDHEGKPYFSLEYLPGGSLSDKLAGTPLPPRDAARLIRTLARAMQAAHELGVIHRDLKPANVLLTKDGIPKITDFGLAKQLGQDSGQTHSGQIMGTPTYMAPEQAAGNIRALGPPTDIYALGAMLYEMLTGRPPFKAASVLDTLDQVRTQEPVPPSQLQPKTPRDLETICLKCLQKDPVKRYASAASLADDVQRFLKGEPVHARPVGQIERFARWCRRNPVVAGLSAAVIMVLLTGTAVAWCLTIDAMEEKRRADANAASEIVARKDSDNNAAKAEANRITAEANAARAEKLALAEAAANVLAQSETKRANLEAKAARKAEVEATLREKEATFEAYRANIARHSIQMDLTLRAWQDRDLFRAEQILREVAPQFQKNWETRHLQSLCQRTVRTFDGHAAGIEFVSYSPDGRTIVTCCADGTLNVWNPQTGKDPLTIKGHARGAHAASFTRDGRRIASVGEDGMLKVWDTQTGEEKLAIKTHANIVRFSPDGKSIFSGDRFGHVNVCDAQTGETKQITVKSQIGIVSSLCFSADCTSIVVRSLDNTLKVFDTQTGDEKLILKVPQSVQCACFSPDGKSIVTGRDIAGKGSGRSLTVWDARTGQDKLALHGHNGSISSVSFSADGKNIVSGSRDNTIMVWDAQTGQRKFTLKGHTRTVTSVSFSPDGQAIASGSGDNTLKVWDVHAGQHLSALEGHTSSVSFSPDGKSIVAARQGNKRGDFALMVLDAQTGQNRFSLDGHSGPVSLSFSHDSRSIVTAGPVTIGKRQEQAIKVWDAHTGVGRVMFKAPTNITCVIFSSDGKNIACALRDKSVKVIDAVTGKDKANLKGHTGPVPCLSFSPDGKYIVSGSWDKTLRIWNAQTGQDKLTLHGHADQVTCVSFSPDGKSIISGSLDTTVKVWDAQTGLDLLTLKGHTGRVYSVCFSPDGKGIVSGSDDKMVKVWDAQTGQDKLTLQGHSAAIFSLSFSSDGRRIFSACKDRSVKIWDTTK